jgi:hypothetical protein
MSGTGGTNDRSDRVRGPRPQNLDGVPPHLPPHAPIYASVRALWLIRFRPTIGSFVQLCALTILQATKDRRKVSVWLGHSSRQATELYTRADPSVKLEALESVIAPKLRTGRFKATDKLIDLLKATQILRGVKSREITAVRFYRARSPHKRGLRIMAALCGAPHYSQLVRFAGVCPELTFSVHHGTRFGCIRGIISTENRRDPRIPAAPSSCRSLSAATNSAG